MPKRRGFLEIKFISSCYSYRIKIEMHDHHFVRNLNLCYTVLELDIIYHKLYAFIFSLD